LYLICLGAFPFLGPASSSEAVANYYKDPAAILTEVSKQGASAIVAQLYANPTEWTFVLSIYP